LYFFARQIREADKVVTVQVSKYVMGYWHSEDFKVSKGEDIGRVVETEPERPETRRLDSRSRLDSRMMSDSRIGPLIRPEDQAVVPETIDYRTGAVMVDVVAVNDWSGVGEKSLSTRRYYDMLYSIFDGTDIKHMPVRTAYWTKDLQKWYSDIRILEREPKEPFKAFSTSGRRRRATRELEYEEYDDEYYMEEMMMEDMGRRPY